MKHWELIVQDCDFTTSYTLTPLFFTADIGLMLKISCQLLRTGNFVQRPNILNFPLDIIKFLKNQASSFFAISDY